MDSIHPILCIKLSAAGVTKYRRADLLRLIAHRDTNFGINPADTGRSPDLQVKM